MKKESGQHGLYLEKKLLNSNKNKTYVSAPWGTPDWQDYWETQLDRCIKGYSVFAEDGTEHKITGHHYFYLNFTQIQIVSENEDDESAVAEKITQNPDFEIQ